MSKRDYYDILGVNKSTSQADLKKAYHKLAMQHHPDRNPGDQEAEKKFKEINAAYDVLKDEQKRAAYDRLGHDIFNASGGGANYQSRSGFGPDVNDMFGDLFNEFMGARSQKNTSPTMPGSDLRYNIEITLEEAFSGTEKNISFTTHVTCTDCHGHGSPNKSDIVDCKHCKGQGSVRLQQGFFTLEQTCGKCQGSGKIIKNPCKKCSGQGRFVQNKNLSVNVPAGIQDTNKIRLAGEGEAGVRGGNNGDLYIFVTVKPHDLYKVEGINVHCKLPISFVNAALGAEVEVPTIEGAKVKLKIPAGTQNGEQLRLKSKGMTQIRSSATGDMFVHIHIETPRNLTKKQQELLEAFDKETKTETCDDSSFFNKMKNLWL